MTTHHQTSNPQPWLKLGGRVFGRQAPALDAPAHSGAFARLWERVGAWRQRRAAVAELSGLSDRELADIGVSRQEIPQVVALRR